MDAFEKYPDLADPAVIGNYDLTTGVTASDPLGPISEFEAAVALIQTEGNLSECAKSLRRSRRSFESFVARNVLLTNLADDILQEFLDEMEARNRSIARLGNDTVIRYILSTLGKDRGYNTRSELTGKNGEPVDVNFEIVPIASGTFIAPDVKKADEG